MVKLHNYKGHLSLDHEACDRSQSYLMFYTKPPNCLNLSALVHAISPTWNNIPGPFSICPNCTHFSKMSSRPFQLWRFFPNSLPFPMSHSVIDSILNIITQDSCSMVIQSNINLDAFLKEYCRFVKS